MSERQVPAAPRAERVPSIDLLRGIVVVLMVVDHARYFLSDARFSPTDLSQTTPELFLTRWITHFCAPAFSLLAGAGAFLSLGRGRTHADLSRFLWTRGIWLLVLELTVARWGWQFNLDYRYSAALVFWSLGWSMIFLAGLVRLPPVIALATGTGLIGLHGLTADFSPAQGTWLAAAWTILERPGSISLGGGAVFDVSWTISPWAGVMAVGYAFGARLVRLKADGPAARDRFCMRLGAALALGFIVLRFINGYGNPTPWAVQPTPVMTVLSFINTTKYPASLDYILMTLGPAIAAIPLLARWSGGLAGVFLLIGRVPLFFWLLHVPVLHAVAAALSLTRYGQVIPWLTSNPPVSEPAGYGYPLFVVYAVTVGVTLALLPACAWYRSKKASGRFPLLSYL